MIWPVQKTGLPYNIVRFPNGPQYAHPLDPFSFLFKTLLFLFFNINQCFIYLKVVTCAVKGRHFPG